MKAKNRRALERVKSLLIVLLFCSAVFLAGQTLFPVRSEGLLSRLPSASSAPAEENPSAFPNQMLRPAAFAVTWSEGRYGQLYYQDDTADYTQLTTLLAEAFSSAGEPAAVTQSVWRSALAQPGLYCEYLGAIPLDGLSLWLSDGENPSLSGFSARRFCVTADALYFVSDDHALPYAAPLTQSLQTALTALFAQFTPNGARFAYEDTSFSPLKQDSLVLLTTPIVPTLTAETPTAISGDTLSGSFSANDPLFSLLQTLSFHPQTNPIYAVGDGFALTDGGETLRISADGQITYKRSDFSTIRYSCEENPLKYTEKFVDSTLGSLSGSAHLYLQNVEKTGQITTISYGFSFYGAKIDLSDTLWCASFTVEDNVLTAFTLRPRRYTVLESGSVALLPQKQASAALSSSDRGVNLLVVYADRLTGEALKPFWALEKEG